jgi:hypothetical protein
MCHLCRANEDFQILFTTSKPGLGELNLMGERNLKRGLNRTYLRHKKVLLESPYSTKMDWSDRDHCRKLR